MESRASIRKHPVHPMLVAFPIGLWTFAFVCDIAYYLVSRSPIWRDMALYTMLGGILTALLAAIPGFIDYLAIKDPRVKKIATAHMLLNLAALAIFVFNLGIRMNLPSESTLLPLVISGTGILLILISGWLGGAMVYRHRMGVVETPAEFERRDRAA